MMSWRPPWRERQERLDAEIDESRATMLAELTRVRKLMRSGVHMARIAFFSVPSEEDHQVAILRGGRAVPKDSTLIVHNHELRDESVPAVETAAWMVGPKFIYFSRGASIQIRNTDDEWDTPTFAPKIDVYGGTHLKLATKNGIFLPQDGVPIQDTANYPEGPHGIKCHNNTDRARMIAAGVHALQLCTPESLDPRVTQFVPHFTGGSNQ
jgi:hypothetical protein